MARRRVRMTLGIVGGVVAVMLVVAVLLPLLVPREKLRSMAETQLREQTGGDVSLGELQLKVFPRLRLVLGSSTITVTGEGLRGVGQDAGPLLEADLALERFEVDLALMPLLRKQLDFGQVSLIEPRLRLRTEPVSDTEVPDGSPGAPGSGPAVTADPAVGLALAAVAVRDGELIWQEEGTGRAVAVRGWQQQLEAPGMGLLLTRLQRLGGVDIAADDVAGDAVLTLDARIDAIELVGFGEQSPPLNDLRLRGSLSVPPAAVHAAFDIEELSLPGWNLTADGTYAAAEFRIDNLALTGTNPDGGETVQLAGSASLVPPPATGPVRCELAGTVDLVGFLDQIEPMMPPQPEDAAPLPSITGKLDVDLRADLRSTPDMADAAAWQAAWQSGLDGTVGLRITGGPITVTGEQLGAPLNLASVTVTSDLASAQGQTRGKLSGIAYPGLTGDASAAFTLPPAAGPLSAELTGAVDLAKLMAQIEPLMPPREPGAAPLPTLDGSLKVALTANLATAPSLADTAAWAEAWQKGLNGPVGLAVRGGPLTVTSDQLGPPLRIGSVAITSDLRSPSGKTGLELNDVNHPGLKGNVVAEIVPADADGVIQTRLELPLLDLDALAAIAEQAKAAGGQARAGFSLVDRAYAADPVQPLVGELIPIDLAADLETRVRELRFLKTPYTDVQMRGTLRERVIDVPQLSARLGTGRVSGTARLDYATDPGGHAAWNVQVANAPASELMRPYLEDVADLWTGTLDAVAHGDCDLADPEAIRNSLTLEGDLSGSDGIIDLRERLAGVSQYLGNRQDLLRVKYSAATKHFKVRDGKVIVEGLRIDGKDTDWIGGGWFSLDGRMDMDLQVRLPAGYTPDLGDLSFVADALRDDQGRIGLDFGLTGPTRAPAVKLKVDPAALMKSDAVQDKVEEEVKKGLGGLLDRLKGK